MTEADPIKWSADFSEYSIAQKLEQIPLIGYNSSINRNNLQEDVPFIDFSTPSCQSRNIFDIEDMAWQTLGNKPTLEPKIDLIAEDSIIKESIYLSHLHEGSNLSKEKKERLSYLLSHLSKIKDMYAETMQEINQITVSTQIPFI